MLRTLFSRFTPRRIPRADASKGRPELLSILIPLPSHAGGHTRSANVCLRFLETLMRFANRRPFENFTSLSRCAP